LQFLPAGQPVWLLLHKSEFPWSAPLDFFFSPPLWSDSFLTTGTRWRWLGEGDALPFLCDRPCINCQDQLRL
jgi:hypothetical protein